MTGQMHHGKRSSRELIASLVSVGLLHPTGGTNSRTGGPAYRTFAKGSAAFPLRDAAGKVAGLYFRHAGDAAPRDRRHRYLRDRRGLYPGYPPAGAKRLLLCESVIDAASAIIAGLTDAEHGGWAVLALYGTSGFTAEHAAAVGALAELEEVCVMLDGDDAGRAGAAAVAAAVREARPVALVTAAELPEGRDANGLLVEYGPEAVRHAVEERAGVGAVTEPPPQTVPAGPPGRGGELPPSPDRRRHVSAAQVSGADEEPRGTNAPPALDASDPLDLGWRGAACAVRVKGLRFDQVDTLKVTARLAPLAGSLRTVTVRCDLYDYRDLERAARAAAERLGVGEAAVAADLEALAAALEGYLAERRRGGADGGGEAAAALTPERRRAAVAVLDAADPLARITELLGAAGIVGEADSRALVWTCVLSYFTARPLHVIIQGSSGSGKTRLLDVVAKSLPAERIRRFTRVTDNAFYNQAPGYYRNRAVLLEDMDGLREEAEYAFRELQSGGRITSSVSTKDERGRITGGEKATEGPIASCVCTTRGEVYEDNASRCLTVAVDESAAQTARVIRYHNDRAAGRVTAAAEAAAQGLLADVARVIAEAGAGAVVNPHAHAVSLPAGVRKVRRLHELYLGVVGMVCRVNHRRRRRDAAGRLVAEVADLRAAGALLFEAIVLKADELDGPLRRFYEGVKGHLADAGRATFTQREVRAALGVSRARCSRHCGALCSAGYLTREYPGNNRLASYRLSAPDDYGGLRARIRAHLAAAVDALDGADTDGADTDGGGAGAGDVPEAA